MEKKQLNINELQKWLVDQIAELSGVAPSTININESFTDYGLSSRDVVMLSGDLEELLGRNLPPTLAYDHPNILALSQYLTQEPTTSEDVKSDKSTTDFSNEPVAIIGMACRFPGASDPNAYWKILIEGIDKISEIPQDRWSKEDFYNSDPSVPGKAVSIWGGFLENIDQFDPYFFGISPIEAKQMDPQQRLLLELSYEAFDNAGYTKKLLDRTKTGVYIGISVNEYSHFQMGSPLSISSHSGTGSALSIAANRISYYYNFRGPSMAVDTACSSSLTAVHLACQSLRNGESKMAIAGGVNMILSPAHSIAFTKAGVLAPDGRCKTFDQDADGYVRGEGGGAVVLKLLSEAIADGDPVQAVILGSAIGQDGHTNGLMAPSQESQESLLREAYSNAGITPAKVQYVEAHGTGTLLGDAMEASALGNVLGVERKTGPCIIGSVKTNIGHLEAAAGMAGLLKVVLSLKHKMIPPSLYYKAPNPHISFNELNLKVQSKPESWPDVSGPAIAGLSSFGFGGTNVHLVVSEIESKKSTNEQVLNSEEKNQLLVLSANSERALDSLVLDIKESVDSDHSLLLSELCSATMQRRSQFDHKIAVIGNSRQELSIALQAYLSREPDNSLILPNPNANSRKLAFVFSGQGGQWIGMGKKLLFEEREFYTSVQKTDLIIQENFNWSLIEVLTDNHSSAIIEDIGIVQPAIFAIQVAISKLFQSWGIVPSAVIGHSMGEVAAAYMAGILSIEDAIKIICIRSIALKTLSGKGSMLATELSYEQAQEKIKGAEREISIAAINGPSSTVLSGDSIVINDMLNKLQSDNIWCKLVKVDVASHSPQMDLLNPSLDKDLASISPKVPNIPIYSTVTGSLGNELSFNAEYWIENLRKPVLFSDTINQMVESGYSFFIEIGPHPVLLGSIKQSIQNHKHDISLFPSLKREESSRRNLLETLGNLYVNGFSITWEQVVPNNSKYVSLPNIQWEGKRYWLDNGPLGSENSLHINHSQDSKNHPLLGERISLAGTQSDYIWRSTISLDNLSYLKDHQVGNTIIFPAAAFIEMAFQAAEELGLLNSYSFKDFVFKQMLELNEASPILIQSVIKKREEGDYYFQLYTKTPSKEDWTLNAYVSLLKNTSEDNDLSFNIESSKFIQKTGEPIGDLKGFYRGLQSRGINYNNNFQGINEMWVRDNESLGHICLPDSLNYTSDKYLIHPVLIDAGLQVIASVKGIINKNELYLPAGCDKILFYSHANKSLWSQVSLQPKSSVDTDEIIADIKLFDENHQLISELFGFKLKKVSISKTIDTSLKDLWLYKLGWKEIAFKALAAKVPEIEKTWLIFSDDRGVGLELEELLTARGDKCLSLTYKDIFKNVERAEDIDLEREIEEILNRVQSSIYGIIHLWSLSISPGTIYKAGSNSVVYLIQKLAKRLESTPKVWLVTKGSQSIFSEDSIDVEQSTLWGLGKVISFELPEFSCVRVDLDSHNSSQQSAALLFKEFSEKTREDQVAYRSNNRFVHRLLPLNFSKPSYYNGLQFHNDGTYVITGGLGDLGLSVAKRIVEKGARHIVLLGRSGPSIAANMVIEEIRTNGAEVVVRSADVSNINDMKPVFSFIKESMPSLRGIIHAAGVLDDGSILNLDDKRMEEVMRPKVDGTRILHESTAHLDLDFFVLFSSAVSVLGSPGQANYAAASAYLDAMSYHRKSLGLNSISINWGPWAEVGLAAEVKEKLEKNKASSQHLVKMIGVDQGLDIMELLLAESYAQIVVLPFDLKDLIELYPLAAGMPFFSEVGGSSTHVARLYARPKLHQQYVAPRNQIELKLAELWQQTLHIDKVGIYDSFFELGGDSVLAAQVLSLARKTYAISINPQEAFQNFTIAKLSEILEGEILKQIEGMSEEEAQRLLSE
jgi:myxalamid-type polyketide synthase MxaE and MxaD